jgi:hypothetical protein
MDVRAAVAFAAGKPLAAPWSFGAGTDPGRLMSMPGDRVGFGRATI